MPSLTPRAAFFASILVATWTSSARADVADECATAAEKAQSLSRQHRLVEAKQELIVCARDACPLVVRRDCVDWLAKSDARIPTVVFRARDAGGRDLIDVQVFVDAHRVVDHLDGAAISLDPGPHSVRFESAGTPAYERRVLLDEGDRNRVVDAVLGAPIQPSSAESPPLHIESSRPIAPFVVAGVGLAALGVFAILDATAYGDYRTARDGCGRTQSCASSDVTSLRTRFDLAAVALGAGIAALGTASVLYFRAEPRVGGGVVTIGLRY